MIDDVTREGLPIKADLSPPAERVVRALHQRITSRGPPRRIRCDNGRDYIGHVMHAWAKQRHIHLDFIQPGKPQQHASVERYDRTVRFDWRSPWRFDRIADVQESATRWRWTYNNARPNMALGGITPIMKLARAAQLHLRHQLKKGGLPSLEVRADTLVGGLRCTWSSTFYRTDGICTIGFTTEMSTGARGFVSVSGAGERY